MKYLIADIVTEYLPKYDYFKNLSLPFEYKSECPAQIYLSPTKRYFDSICRKMSDEIGIGRCECFAYSCLFSKEIISYNAMLIHSSAIKYNGKAYLFSAQSGVGKSTHTALWKKAFGSMVEMINDDKPVVRVKNGRAVAFGTPFDGGSGIANNISAPVGAVVFVKRGEKNSVRKAENSEIISNLYHSTSRYLTADVADKLLNNIEELISCCDFYILTCNTDISAAYTARDAIVK